MSFTKLLTCSLTLLWLSFSCLPAAAAPQILKTEETLGENIIFDPGDFAATLRSIDGDRYALRLAADSNGYGRATFQNHNYRINDWRAYGSVSFDLKNTGQSVGLLNFAVHNSPLVSLRLEDSGRGYGLWQKAGSPYTELLAPVNGMLEILPGEEGRLTIPFTALTYKNKHWPLTDFFGVWQLDFAVQSASSPLELEFGNFSLNGGYLAGGLDLRDLPGLAIHGDASLPLPADGAESIALYRASGLRGAVFSLAAPYPGAAITPQGRLTVTAAARPGKLTVLAREAGGRTAARQVLVTLPQLAGVQGAFTSILPTSKVPQYDTTSLWYRPVTYRTARFILTGGLLFMLGLYLFGRRLNKKLAIGQQRSGL